MANPTTNYGFVLPTPTDLVTDLPADFDVALQGVDTRLKALQPGTTSGDLAYSSATANTNVRLGIGTAGQVLAVVSGVPAWTTGTAGDIEGVTAGIGISGGGTSGTVTVTNSMATAIDAKGDLVVGTAGDTFSRLAVGATNGMVLTVDSAEATGLKYATPAAGGKVLQVVNASTSTTVGNSTSTYVDTSLTATITPTLNTSKVLVLVSQNGCGKNTSDTCVDLQLLRGSTEIVFMEGFGGDNGSTTRNFIGSISCNFLDAPATTSATTYKTRIKSDQNNARVFAQDGRTVVGTSTITLMEIGA